MALAEQSYADGKTGEPLSLDPEYWLTVRQDTGDFDALVDGSVVDSGTYSGTVQTANSNWYWGSRGDTSFADVEINETLADDDWETDDEIQDVGDYLGVS